MVRYKLTPKGTGLIIDRPELLDLDSRIELSFLLATGATMIGEYYAVITNNAGIERKFRLVDGKVLLPNEMARPQVYMLYVVQVKGDNVIKRWNCVALKLSNLADISKLKLEVGTEYSDLDNKVNQCIEGEEINLNRITALEAENQIISNEMTMLRDKLNEAITSINALSERIGLLEE